MTMKLAMKQRKVSDTAQACRASERERKIENP